MDNSDLNLNVDVTLIDRQPKHLDVTIKGRDFRIGLLSAKLGFWLYTQFGANRFADMASFTVIQDMLFGVCEGFVEDANGNKVTAKLYEKGRWMLKQYADIADDLDTMALLHETCMDFNLGPFFMKQREREERKKKQDEERKSLGTTQ